MNKKALDRLRLLAAQPVAQSADAREIVTAARELTGAELAEVTGGLGTFTRSTNLVSA